MVGPKIVLPFYHLVSDNPPAHIQHLYEARTFHDFKEDLDFLLKHYQPISLNELIEINNKKEKLKGNYFHLTFDDGLKDNITEVVSILKERKIPGTFFINTDFIDNKALFYRFKESILVDKYAADGLLDCDCTNSGEIDELAILFGEDFNNYLEKEQPYLTSDDINNLIKEGFTIGAHSKNHLNFNTLNLNEQLEQTLESVKFITKKFQLEYKVFSFPFTDDGISVEFFNKIKNQVDLTFGTAGLKNDSISFNLQRIPMEENKKGIEIIKSQYLYYILKSFVGKNLIKR